MRKAYFSTVFRYCCPSNPPHTYNIPSSTAAPAPLRGESSGAIITHWSETGLYLNVFGNKYSSKSTVQRL